MSHLSTQAIAIGIMNTSMIKAHELPSNYADLAQKWAGNKDALFSNEFKTFWVIVRTSGNYNLYCGNNVVWSNTSFNIPRNKPDLILVIEENVFKGIVVGDPISQLIDLGMYGIFMWLMPIPVESKLDSIHRMVTQLSSPMYMGTDAYRVTGHLIGAAPAPQTLMQFMVEKRAPPPTAYIRAGDTLIPVPHGTSVQVIPNRIEPMMNISHFRRCYL